LMIKICGKIPQCLFHFGVWCGRPLRGSGA
jgi:hypothetical protein